jgi:hypothetical protein
VSPLSFAYFSLRRRPEGSALGVQRKVSAAAHRGNANRPIRKQEKAQTKTRKGPNQNKERPKKYEQTKAQRHKPNNPKAPQAKNQKPSPS